MFRRLRGTGFVSSAPPSFATTDADAGSDELAEKLKALDI